MKNLLFNVPNNVTNDEVIERMTYYYEKSNEISDIFENDRLTGKELARELREDLKKNIEIMIKFELQNFIKNTVYLMFIKMQ